MLARRQRPGCSAAAAAFGSFYCLTREKKKKGKVIRDHPPERCAPVPVRRSILLVY
jgi:hypothetical protein